MKQFGKGCQHHEIKEKRGALLRPDFPVEVCQHCSVTTPANINYHNWILVKSMTVSKNRDTRILCDTKRQRELLK